MITCGQLFKSWVKCPVDTVPPPGLPIVITLGYFMHDGGHGTVPDDWQVFINFLNIQLRAKMN